MTTPAERLSCRICFADQQVTPFAAEGMTTMTTFSLIGPDNNANSVKKQNHGLYRKKVVMGRGCHD